MTTENAAAKLGASLASQYEIEREIGSGGMATVYLARDRRHERKVALKVLRPELGAVLGVERFLSEIRVTANLQHPNLLPLFDSGEAAGLLYYVMPFVEGESLRARLDRERQLPIDEATRIAVLVAGALDYAHAAGVIHRDLKPENILLSRGQPLVADFGIALAVSLAGGARVTQTGLSLGTPQYMSPEQAAGDRQIDARSDVYSLAAVLYEMLTGDPPHSASTVQGVIAKVLTERPASVRVSRPNVPEYIDAAITSALEKLPADRIATAGEFARAIDGKSVALPLAYPAASRTVVTAQVVDTSLARKMREPLTASFAILSACAALFALWAWNRPASRVAEVPTTRFTISVAVPPSRGSLSPRFNELAISADGRLFVWATATAVGDTGALWLRPGNSLEAIPIPGTQGARRPEFSPDGKWIAFQLFTEVKKVSLDGFSVVDVGGIGGGRELGHWIDNDTLVLEGRRGIALQPVSGGAPRVLTTPDATGQTVLHTAPYAPPGGDGIFFTVVYHAGRANESDLAVVSRRTGKVSMLGLGLVRAIRLVDAYLIYQTSPEGLILAVPLNPAFDSVAGAPVPLMEFPLGARISESGTLFTIAGAPDDANDIVALSLDGTQRVITPVAREVNAVRYSPNGRRIAMGVSLNGSSDIWLYDVASGTQDRFTRDGGNQRAEWSPDGNRIVYTHRGEGDELWWKSADGIGAASMLQRGAQAGILSTDGRWLVWRGAGGIWYRQMSGDTTARKMSPDTRFRESSPHLARGGKWLTYASSETGDFRIYARAFPGPSQRFPVSLGGALEPMWSSDGKTIYYREGPSLIAASVITTPQFEVTGRKTIASHLRSGTNQSRNYDISPDGSHFILVEPRPPEGTEFLVVQNWVAEVRARLHGSPRK